MKKRDTILTAGLGAAGIIIGLLAIPQINATIFPAKPELNFYVSVERGIIDGQEYDTTIRPGQGSISETFTVTISNSGNARATNIQLLLTQSPQSNGWYDFHNWISIEGIKPEDSTSSLVRIPEIAAGERSIIDYKVTFYPPDYDQVKEERPKIEFTLSHDGIVDKATKTYYVTMP